MPSVEIKRGDGTLGLYDIHAAPLIDDDGSLVGIAVNYVDITHASQLRSELERLGQELQSHKEELGTTNEELQSTVEELETTNEELQSTNEELETLNEELESTNAELNSINTDLQLRTREVERLNTLLLAVTGNIEVGAAVLDGGMRVQLWNERAADLWGVRSDEVVGSSFFNLDIGLPAEQLRALIRAGAGGRPLHDELVVKATTRKGREIRCRVIAHAIGDGDRPAGVVLVMEELKP
jgi:two-component system CheB/CheR fusion protein